MKLALNLLWFLFGGGIFAATLWITVGGLLALTVVGLPFAVAGGLPDCQFCRLPFWPPLGGCGDAGWEQVIPGTRLVNLLWIILAGIWLTIASACTPVIGRCLCP